LLSPTSRKCSDWNFRHCTKPCASHRPIAGEPPMALTCLSPAQFALANLAGSKGSNRTCGHRPKVPFVSHLMQAWSLSGLSARACNLGQVLDPFPRQMPENRDQPNGSLDKRRSAARKLKLMRAASRLPNRPSRPALDWRKRKLSSQMFPSALAAWPSVRRR
jgi:hypothetical protein